ncbi:MAG: UDP-N-acetylglucosamine 1-carboxyvinyltransferase [Puniceicoccaceae bacterium]
MDVFRITGGFPLSGRIRVGGAKNAALPALAAAVLTDEPVTLSNVPDLSDIRFMVEILQYLGATVEKVGGDSWRIEAKKLASLAPYDLVRKMRASICLLGAMVGRLREAEISIPGGCVIGPRPIDLHLKGLARLGCTIETRGGYIKVKGAGLRGNRLFLGGRYGSTVTGTVNMVMAAAMAPGETVIDCAACEPEVTDLCEMLNRMGARISGAGSPSIRVEGVERLHGCEHRIVTDRIEAGTYLIGAAMLDGDIEVEGVEPNHLGALIDKFEEAGITVRINGDVISVERGGTLAPVDVITLPHPGFPTDLQAQMCSLMSLTRGISIITERIYPNRFMHVPELQRMGADIAMEGATAIIKGRDRLSGAPTMASDLRASAALVLAAFAAKGDSWIQRVYHIDRGYERIDEKFAALGARIERLPASAMPSELKAEE